MKCDGGLHPKLEMYELTKFLNTHTTSLFLGKPRSGKTSLIYSLFKSQKLMKKVFTSIYIFQPSASRESMSDQLFNQLPKDQLYEELTFDNLNEVLGKIKSATSDENHCIILDDMTAYLKNKDTLQLFKEIVFNRRHLHVSLYVLSQTYISVPKEIRKLFNNLFIFKCSKSEIENLFEEIVEQKKELVPIISKMVFDKQYNFLFINTESGRMFKGWDEIIINDDLDE
jgi:GTPase SAR1 family protein